MFKKLTLLGCLGLFTSVASAEEIKFYVADSLKNVVTDAISMYQQQHQEVKITPVFTDATSITQLIQRQNNDIDLYLSNDLTSFKMLKQQNNNRLKREKFFANNQLVAISDNAQDIPFGPSKQFNFSHAFKGKLCTASLNNSTLGMYTQQSLNNLGWTQSLQSRIIQKNNIQDILTSVENGQCDVGVIYQTDALTTKKIKMMGIFPETAHQPINYYIQMTPNGLKSKQVRAFERFMLNNTQVKNIVRSYGFTTQHKYKKITNS